MRKSKFLAMTLALALVAGTIAGNPVAVNATDVSGNQEGSSSAETQEVQKITEVKWVEGEWSVSFKISNEEELASKSGVISVNVYENGTWVGGGSNGIKNLTKNDSGEYSISVADYIVNDNAKYKVEVSESVIGDDNIYTSYSDSVYTEEREYDAPENRLVVKTPTWDEDNVGIVYFEPIEGAEKYWAFLYKVEGNVESWAGWTNIDAANLPDSSTFLYKTDDGKIAVNWLNHIKSRGEGTYCATIQAFSSDINTTANSTVAKSAAFHTSEVAAKVSDAITEAMTKGTAEEKVAAIKGNTTSADLSMSMQVDSAVLEQVKTLEDSYKSEKKVEVAAPTVSADAGVDSTRISMVGAAFNAAENSKVSLSVDVPEETDKVDIPGYNTAVQLDIKLEMTKQGEMTGSSVTTLDMPITITMPMPSGVKNLDKLVLWHCHNDGNKEKATFKNNGDGTITFTVTSFSIFVFAEETGSSSQSSSSGSSDDNDSSSSSTVSTAQTVTEEKTASVPTQYVVKRGDCMAKIARKYGMTLGKLISLNPQVKNPSKIYVGQVLIVGYTTGSTTTATVAAATDTANAEYYTIQRGDSLYKIAVKSKVSLPKLKALNADLFAQKYIYAGQKVRLK